MSVLIKDKITGEWVHAAGQGKAEYGASTERKGDITIPATTAGNFQSVNVVFAQAMPDNDYTVAIDEGLNTWAHCTVNVTNKTATGFTLFFLNVAGADAPQMAFKYRAFKLYTDTEYNNLLDNAVLTSDVTDAVTNGDMNPVTSNAVFDAILNNVKKGKYISKGVCNYNGKTYFAPGEYAGNDIKLLVFYVSGENNCLGMCCVNGWDISGFSYVDGTLNNLEYIIYNGTNTPAFKVSNDSDVPVAVFELGLGY